MPEPVVPGINTAPHLSLAPTIVDEKTGARWNKEGDGYKEVIAPWAIEDHISPPSSEFHLGDVESLAAYIAAYGLPKTTLIAWNAKGILATLDFHNVEQDLDIGQGRCQFLATHYFQRSREWTNWHALADDKPHSQKEVVEKLEEWADDIIEPGAAELANILRSLRANVSAQSETTINPDGTNSVRFTKDNKVTPLGNVDLPETFKISIPVLTGHEDLDPTTGKYVPVTYVIRVRVRVTIQDNAALYFRFSLQGDEKILQDVINERLGQFKVKLGTGYTLYRAAD